MHVRHGHLGGRDQEVVVRQFERVLLKLRQLTRARHRGAVDHERRKYFGIAVCGVCVEKEVDDRAFEPGAEPFIEMEARAGDFGGGLRVEDAEVGADVPVGLRVEVERSRLAPAADLDVFAVVLADRRRVARNVRDLQQQLSLLLLKRVEFVFVSLDRFLDLVHFLHDLADVAAALFDLRNQLACVVLLRFQPVALACQLTALLVNGDDFVHNGVHVLVARFHRALDAVGIFADQSDV